MSSKAKFIDEIKKMTVMELAELIKELEETFGVSAAAPAAAVAMPAAGGAAPAAAAEEKSEYKVTLKESGADKIKVIKALRAAVSTLSLGAAKEAVDNTPFVVAEAASKDDAQKIKKALEEAGAKVELA
jgi:large subunit ribosomal protein L7/L12